MSDVMLFGVLRMPMEMAMADDLSRMQFYQRAQQAADRIEELERQLAERDAQQEKQIGREPTDAMQAAGTQAIRFDTTLLNKMWTANAVFRAMWDAATPSAPSVSADATLQRIADVFGIGSGARTPDTILANIENAARRSKCLSAIEDVFFTTTTQDDDGEEHDDCPLNWGADPAEYVEQFRAAIASQSKEGGAA